MQGPENRISRANGHPIFQAFWWVRNLLFCASATATLSFVLLRAVSSWLVDRPHIPRFHLRKYFQQAGAALFSAPEIQQ